MSTLPQPEPHLLRRTARRVRPTAGLPLPRSQSETPLPRTARSTSMPGFGMPKAVARSEQLSRDRSRPVAPKTSPRPVAPERVTFLTSKRPLWLRWLLRAQRSSLLLTFVLMGVALSVYSSTVYTQQLWGKEYSKLKTMQRHERQLVTVGEALKTQLAEQAEHPDSGLVPKPLDGMVVVPAAPPRPLRSIAVSAPPAPPTADRPRGY